MTTDAILRIRGLSKSFDGHPVLRSLDLDIAPGRVLGLLGSNGAGKTTTINVMTGLLAADSGSIERFDAAPEWDWRRRIGVAPQEVSVYERLTATENISFFGGLYRLRGPRLASRTEEMIGLAQLADYRDVRASKLSGGTRRRLNLAVAFVHEPSLLILDEPTAGLDVEARYALWSVIRDLRTAGTGVLLTTHLLDEAAALCDRIAILHEGRVEREGTLDDLIRTVPARQVADVESDDEAGVCARAEDLGLTIRRHGGRIALRLEQETTLEAIVQTLAGTRVRSIALRPVSLEDVYFDATSR